MKKFAILLTLLASGHFASAQNTLVAGLRANETVAKAYAATTGKQFLEKTAEEFSNGNTFVRLKQAVSFATVDLLLPTKLTSNSMMEALITIYTLRKNGASRVRVVMSSSRVNVDLTDMGNKRMAIESWLRVAGATSMVLNGRERALRKQSSRIADIEADHTVIVGAHHPTLATELSKLTGFNVVKDSHLELIKGNGVLLVSPAPEPVNANFLETLGLVAELKAKGAAFVELLTPYLPYARSDKVDQFGVAVTGKLVAALIEAAGVDAVSFVRAHAPQSEGFFNIPTRNITGRKTINAFLKEQNVDMVVSPDAGFQKDATLYADELGTDVAVINKQRDPLTGQSKIVGISGVDVRGKTLAIIDDETASGGTLGKAAEYLKSLGAGRILAVVTHLTGNAKGALESAAIDRVVVTDTLPVTIEHPKLSVLSTAGELSEEIFSVKFDRTVRSCRAVTKGS